jgi:hypothetical protein
MGSLLLSLVPGLSGDVLILALVFAVADGVGKFLIIVVGVEGLGGFITASGVGPKLSLFTLGETALVHGDLHWLDSTNTVGWACVPASCARGAITGR